MCTDCPLSIRAVLCVHRLYCVSTGHPVCSRAILCVHGLSSEYTGHPVYAKTVLCEHGLSAEFMSCPVCAWVQRHTHLAHHQASPLAFGTVALSSLCLFPLIAAALLLCPQSFCSAQLLFQEDSGPFPSCQHLHLQVVTV